MLEKKPIKLNNKSASWIDFNSFSFQNKSSYTALKYIKHKKKTHLH